LPLSFLRATVYSAVTEVIAKLALDLSPCIERNLYLYRLLILFWLPLTINISYRPICSSITYNSNGRPVLLQQPVH